MIKKQIEPHIFIILGATGNLARRKLFPALYQLSTKGVLEGKSVILGVSRSKEYNDTTFRDQIKKILETTGLLINDKTFSEWCEKRLHYHSIGEGNLEDYRRLSDRILELETPKELSGNRVFYMALPPNAFPPTIKGLGESGLNKGLGWTRIVIEKPFGHDLESAKVLNNLVHKHFQESQIYRIDHFLGKETVQNLLVFRFANAFFEHLWNREHIESIDIVVAENQGIEKRANYYEQSGALRDMVENHLTQLLTLVAMEPPTTFESDAIRNEKIKILHQITPIKSEDVVFGQYTDGVINGKKVRGYKEELGVPPESKTETFVGLRLEIANWRWAGVPFFLFTGKRMPQRITEIKVRFQCAPVSIFAPFGPACSVQPNVLTITIQPDEGFDLKIQVKSLGQPMNLTAQSLNFKYSEAFGSPPDAYEALLLDVINGDQTLFVHSDEVESAWSLYTPLLKMDKPIRLYPAGSGYPSETDSLYMR
jgi:glucose-6-phosphate 1-dehydrogenase